LIRLGGGYHERHKRERNGGRKRAVEKSGLFKKQGWLYASAGEKGRKTEA
jgi:hypothetical protein